MCDWRQRLILPDPSHDEVNERGQKGVAYNKNNREIHCDSFPTLCSKQCANLRPNGRPDVYIRRPNQNRQDWLAIVGVPLSLTSPRWPFLVPCGESNSILPESDWILATVAVL